MLGDQRQGENLGFPAVRCAERLLSALSGAANLDPPLIGPVALEKVAAVSGPCHGRRIGFGGDWRQTLAARLATVFGDRVNTDVICSFYTSRPMRFPSSRARQYCQYW